MVMCFKVTPRKIIRYLHISYKYTCLNDKCYSKYLNDNITSISVLIQEMLLCYAIEMCCTQECS